MNFQKIKINHFYSSHSIREPNSNDDWDRGDSRKDHSINGFTLVKNNDGNYYDFIVDNFSKDKEYYLVYVLYDTGDSFGRNENEICFVEFLDDLEDAENLCKLIEENEKLELIFSGKKQNYNISFQPKNGKERKISTGTWRGYFESFNGVYISSMRKVSKYMKNL